MTEPGALLVDRYECGQLLGSGGMAVVHAGHDRRLDRPVAIKTLRPAMAARPEIRSRFQVEAQAAASLSHPHAVAVYDTGEDAGIPFIVMERLPGETLADRIAEGVIDPEWLRRVALDVLDALEAAHSQGLVHRDIKPGNVLLTIDGRAKVGDFGIAKSLEGTDDLTTTGAVVGTPAYLAPERLSGGPATPQTDLYGLGVVLYEALAGSKPFGGDSAVAVAYAIHHVDPAPLAEVRPELDPHLAAAVHRAMARDPAERFATAADMSTVLAGTAVPVAGRAALAGVPLSVPPDGDATAVWSSAALGASAVDADATAVMAGEAGAAGAAVRAAPPADVLPPIPPDAARPPYGLLALALLGLALLVAGAAMLADGDSGGTALGAGEATALSASFEEAATRLDDGDGPRGVEAAERLRSMGRALQEGKTITGDAEQLLTDALAWQASGQIGVRAGALIVETLAQVPGVGSNAVTPLIPLTTAAPPPPTTAPAATDEEEREKGRGNGNGNGRGNDGDD